MNAEVLRILVVDDEPVDRIAVRRYLASIRGASFTVDEASDGAAALAALARAPADCVLLDLYLPDTTGLDWMRAFPEGRERPPVVLLTGLADHQTALEALQSGAEDYLVKDELTAGLLARTIRHAVERGRTRRALEESRRKIEEVAFLDPLTGVLNRRGLEHMLRGDLARAERAGVPLSAILLDCDDFKGVNTLHGHAGGDEVLKEVAARLRGALRPSDRVARVGGDEFLIIAPDTSHAETMGLAERLRLVVSAAPIPLPLGRVYQRVTMGVFAVPASAATVTDLLAVGSAVVLESKAAGKDRIAGAADGRPAARGEDRAAGSARAPLCQPIVRLADDAIVGHEVALRGAADTAAGDDGAALDLATLARCGRAAPRDGRPVHLALRWSTLELRTVEEVLAQLPADLPRAQLCLAFDADQLVGPPAGLLPRWEALQAAGVRRALTGATATARTLELIFALAPEVVKLDRQLVRRAGDRASARALERLARIARALDATVIADGIETERERSLAAAAGIDAGQGPVLDPGADRPGPDPLAPAGGSAKAPAAGAPAPVIFPAK